MNYLDSLNTEQRKAVEATDGPVLIVAGAGAGKTKTLTHRIFHLIQQGIAPESILAITFTNKAAKEMRERVMHLLNSPRATLGAKENSQGWPLEGHTGVPFVSTFHSLGVMIIKENAPLLGLPRHFTIFDTADSKKVLKDALTYIGVEPKEHLDKIRHIISGEKSRGTNLSEYLERESYDYTSELAKKAWRRYEEILARDKALDFDDLLLKSLHLLEKNTEVRERYQKRFKYVHIDEYQDTNKVQNRIVELIADLHGNVCVVGDTDQNIYSWRGAEIQHMLRFEKKYPSVQTIFLEQNYRSTKTILGAANEIIEKNKFRIPKKLFTENAAGDPIGVFEARSEIDEAHFIALTCKDCIDTGSKPDTIAVLYRANFQSRVIEEAFLAYGVPYQLLGTKFFERKEVKDVVSFVRAAINPESQADFLRIVNIPPRGIGKVTIDKIIEGQEMELSPAVQAKVDAFRTTLAHFGDILRSQTPSESIKYIITHSGMEKMYENKTEEDAERLENIRELVTLAKKYDAMPPEEGLELFLTESALASDQDSLDSENQKTGVKLMTVHASKGLEFETVFISGLESDLFPHAGWGEQRKSGEEAEEERRLFYVALTRARQKLFLTWAGTRTIFGNMQVNAPSEFLGDIPKEHVEYVSWGEGARRANTHAGSTLPAIKHNKPLIKIEF